MSGLPERSGVSLLALVGLAAAMAFTPATAKDPKKTPEAPKAPEADEAEVTEPAAGEAAVAPTNVIEEQVIPPQVIIKSQVAPDYPPAALDARMEGVVVVELVVRKDGTVGDGKVLTCNHPAIGFEEAALAATKQWRFEPALKEGLPIEYTSSFRVNFRLAGGQPYISWGASGTTGGSGTRAERPTLSNSARSSSAPRK